MTVPSTPGSSLLKEECASCCHIDVSPVGSSSTGKEEISLSSLNDDCDYEKLRAVDPHMADQVHPNDSRKIHRYLQMYELTGLQPSVVWILLLF